jgi:hypothetical protein
LKLAGNRRRTRSTYGAGCSFRGEARCWTTLLSRFMTQNHFAEVGGTSRDGKRANSICFPYWKGNKCQLNPGACVEWDRVLYWPLLSSGRVKFSITAASSSLYRLFVLLVTPAHVKEAIVV